MTDHYGKKKRKRSQTEISELEPSFFTFQSRQFPVTRHRKKPIATFVMNSKEIFYYSCDRESSCFSNQRNKKAALKTLSRYTLDKKKGLLLSFFIASHCLSRRRERKKVSPIESLSFIISEIPHSKSFNFI